MKNFLTFLVAAALIGIVIFVVNRQNVKVGDYYTGPGYILNRNVIGGNYPPDSTFITTKNNIVVSVRRRR